ncbi:MAG: terpene cyclase/mutase family protein [Lentisphaeria bacterium]|nr:terpene cyclase/mutase family protein [Lentisphaeria bacterium]NQZ68423.1 terpene cyclase/mutase family protein [Lentisphaeria bacterium]
MTSKQVLSSFLLSLTLFASDVDKAHLEKISKKDNVDKAIEAGIKYLVKNQIKADGSFEGLNRNNSTGLACLALMASGHFPGQSKYGKYLTNGINYLIAISKKNKGYFGKEGNGRMYVHGICTLALTEAYGMLETPKENKRLKEALLPALELIVRTQTLAKNTHFGGWHYMPKKQATADLSVSAWQILALRSAQNCKLPVPQKTIDNAITYVRKMFNPRDKAFTYNGNGATTSMRSAGVVCMNVLGANQSEADKLKITQSASYLLGLNPAGGGSFYYQSYYVGSAANMMGGRYRETMIPKLEKVLLKLQVKNGSFSKHTGHQGGVYSTAFAVICLAIRYQYLPIYQE